MMILGGFAFDLLGASYDSVQRSQEYNWAQQERLGSSLGAGGPALMFMGIQNETMSISGTMYPQHAGGSLTMAILRLEAAIGVPLPLIDSQGGLLGTWVIKQIEETKTIFLGNGAARKIEFSLSLQRYVEYDLLFF
ncbi:MAG: phage tail protein [Gammaproteobacteria bacterium]|nr:phage tail protein [Gammaproteobacteria bacterium]